MAATLTQRKGEKVKESIVKDAEEKPKTTKPITVKKEDNFATITNFLIPMILFIYLGIVLGKYSLAEYNGLVTNKFLLLGK